MDCVPTNTHSSRVQALLYIIEGNEAVIKMITKGRSPTMRHVSRTHRVALAWLFERVNLGSQDSNQVCQLQTPTGRHVIQRLVSHVPFLDVFLQSFSFNQKALHHVEESSGKDRRRTRGVGIEDLDEPTSFLDHVYLECIQCESKPKE